MNEIQITRWQPLNHHGAVIASFNFKIRGIIVRAAHFKRAGDGYTVVMPFTVHALPDGRGLLAVGLDRECFSKVTAAAVSYCENMGDGLGRVLCAGGEEALEIAGV